MRWSSDHSGYRFEYFNGQITIVGPTGGKSGIRNSELHAKLYAWAKVHGYRAFGSDAGFAFGKLKVAPDESLLRVGRFEALSPSDQEKLVPLAPDVAVELVSKTQEHGKRREDLDSKCQAMFDDGVSYVVLLDPYTSVEEERVTTWGQAPAHFPETWDDLLNA